MSTHRPHRIDRFTAERLLRGEVAGPHELAELLAAAAAPAQPDELAGEEAAVTAFREAHLIPASRPRRRSMITKLLTLKVAAAALTATAAGGVALAAGTGHLPDSMSGSAKSTARPDTGKTAAGAKHAKASPSPSLVGLCRAFRAGAGDNPGKALQSPAFTALITAAGGKDNVAAFCADLLKNRPGKGSHPTGAPTSHPTGAPTSHPTGAPTSHPTGAPTSHPTCRPGS